MLHGDLGGQKRALDPLDLELWTVVNYTTVVVRIVVSCHRVLGIELRSSARIYRFLNH